MFFFNALAQDNVIDKINYALKCHNYDKAYILTKQITNKALQSLYINQIEYYRKGTKINDISSNMPQMLTIRDSIVYYYLKGDIYTINRRVDKNEEILNYYLQSYRLASKENDSLLISEALKKMCNHLIFESREDTVYIKQYVSKLKKYCKDEEDDFWHSYYQIIYNGLLKDYMLKYKVTTDTSSFKFFKKKEMMSLFNNMRVNSKNNNSHKALYHKVLGAYQADWLKDYILANQNMVKSKNIYQNSNYWYGKNMAKGLDYNMALNYYYNEEYHKAIPILEKDLNRDKKKLYIMYTHEYLYLSYKAINKTKEALFNFEQMHRVKDELDQIRYAISIKKINKKYNKKEVELALNEQKGKNIELEKENESLENSLLTIVPVFGFVTVVLLLVFYLYKRYKKKSTLLEAEQSETLKKLDEIKKIVVKNHIVLKDKTKVYISDLMYIKSEDHYLNIFLSDDKNHFVRGKLSQIKTELPPNFIQCHRSYIVNSNFIKQINGTFLVLMNKEQIPLSRSYKDKF